MKCIENWKILPLSNPSDELIDKYILHFDIIFCARDYTLSTSLVFSSCAELLRCYKNNADRIQIQDVQILETEKCENILISRCYLLNIDYGISLV